VQRHLLLVILILLSLCSFGMFATGGCDRFVNVWDDINKKILYQVKQLKSFASLGCFIGKYINTPLIEEHSCGELGWIKHLGESSSRRAGVLLPVLLAARGVDEMQRRNAKVISCMLCKHA
jgi:hypothetical protein